MRYQSLITTTVFSLAHLTVAQIRPPNLSPDNLPDTAFTCEDKVTGGYYADVEADCQLFHVCVQVSEYEFQDFHFLCPNDTVFDQQHLVCTNWFEVDCHAQLAFFTNDFGIKRGSFEDEDINEGTTQNSEQSFLGFNQNSGLSSRLRNTGRGQLEVGRRRSGQPRRFPTRGFSDINEYDEDEDVAGGPAHSDRNVLRPAITGTPIPLGFTTTIRPAGNSGVVSTGGFLSGRNLVRNHESSDVNESDNIDEVSEVPPKSSFAKFGRDGRRPKVKSNIRAKLANSGGKKNFFQKTDKTRKKSGRKVNLDHIRKNRIEFVEPNEEESAEEEFSGPEVRPDGRSPRVKSNILSEQQNRPETTTLEPFIEQFFASPSSPQPFVFRGSPTPRPFGSASTAQPFFIPTVKSANGNHLRQTPLTLSVSTSDATPPPPSQFLPPAEFGQETDQGSEEFVDERPHAPTNRFVSRPSPARFNNKKRIRGRNRVIVKSEEPSSSHDDITTHQSVDDDLLTENTEKPKFFTSPRKEQKPRVKSNLRHRKKKIHTKFNNVDLNSVPDDDCNNPFECPPKSVAAGRRPRVKSNVRAGKRNFWQKQKTRGFSQTKNREFGVGQQGRNRKIRRGRKQKSQFTNEIANQSNEINDDESDLSNLIDDSDVNEPTEQFFPTTRTTPKKEVTTKSLEEEENEIFDDFFDQQNDLFVASSTVSPVVFKGSPGPGFFSSPRPNFDSHGSQVSFTSPNPFGPGGPSGRPSFNNIGAHIDLGPQKPQKILEPEQLFFISSTVSNKIFIGAEEETTTPTPVSQEENTGIKIVNNFKSTTRNFPSFPIRAGTGGFPFKPKPDFSRRNKAPFRFGLNSEKKEERKESEEETESVETTEPALSSTESTTTTTDSAPVKLSIPLNKFNRKSPRVKSNLLFNRKNRPVKNRFAQKLSFSSTTETVPSEKPDVAEKSETESETEIPAEETPTEASTEAEEVVAVQTPRTRKHRFQNRNKFSPLSRVPNISATNTLLSKRKFRGRTFGNQRKEAPKEEIEIVTEAHIEDSAEELTTTEPAQKENILSVESELLDDADNEEDNDISIEEHAVTEKKKPRKKWPSVKKANRAPPNANIRVEFKKKTAAENKLKGFFVKPDGRKPRVKSNIRAKFAHRGQQFGQQHDNAANGFRHSTKVEKETFDGASSQLDLTPFEGSEEDNTEKREVNNADAPFSPALLNQILNSKDEKQLDKQNSFPLPLQPVILNPRQLRDQKPSLPPAILQHISHITNINSLPPLPSFTRTPKALPARKTKQKTHGQFSFSTKQPAGVNILEDNTTDDKDEALQLTHHQPSNSPSTLLEQIVANTNENSSSSESLPNKSSSLVEKPTSPGFKNKLSAFRALQKQIEKSDESSDINDYISSDELTDHITHTDLV